MQGVRGVEMCSGVLNIKPISSLMKCKYYGESLNWNTERKGAKGGSDSLFQVFTFRLPRLRERSVGREWKKREKKFVQKSKLEGNFQEDTGESRRGTG